MDPASNVACTVLLLVNAPPFVFSPTRASRPVRRRFTSSMLAVLALLLATQAAAKLLVGVLAHCV